MTDEGLNRYGFEWVPTPNAKRPELRPVLPATESLR